METLSYLFLKGALVNMATNKTVLLEVHDLLGTWHEHKTSLHGSNSLQCNKYGSSEERSRKYLKVKDVNCMIFCIL